MADEKPEYNFTVETLAADLAALGLAKGDAVLMHSNAASIGPARQMAKAPDTGMAWVLQAIFEVIGPDGILSVPTFTKAFKSPTDGPTGETWNPATTPSRVGSLTNYVLRQPGRARSEHPTHPIAAMGLRAQEFCAGHSWREGASTFDRKGPWGRLVDWNGKILWLGTDMRTQTCAHVVEDWMRLPYMATCVALVEDGGATREIKVTQSPAGPRDFYRKNSKLELAWNAAGKARAGKVCRADAALMGAPDFVDWLWNSIKKDPALLLSDNPNCAWSAKARKETAEHLARFDGTWRK